MRKVFQIMFAITLIFTNLELTSLEPSDLSIERSKESHRNMWHSLQRGNRKFVHSRKYARQRKPLVKGQDPHTIILSCVDSRVPPEIVFSQGLGELFVVRSAGQVTDLVVIDSIEFAVRSFKPSSIIVMGHTDCGAVKGALERLRRNGGQIDTLDDHLNAVLIPIETAIKQAGIDIYAPNALELATRANIKYIISQLIFQSKPIAQAIEKGKLSIIGAEYQLKSGKVKKLFTIEKK